jgi:hypothetical protein
MGKGKILNWRSGMLAMLVAGLLMGVSTTATANWGGGYSGEKNWQPRWQPRNVHICNVQWWKPQPTKRTVWMKREVAERLSNRWSSSWVVGRCQDKIPVCHIKPNGKTQTKYLPIYQAYRRANLWSDRWVLGKCQDVISPY